MKLTGLFAALLLSCLPVAQAAPATTPPYVLMDSSSDMLMDKTTALAMWKEHLPLKLAKLYPVGKWGFLSQVEGGFDDAKVCVVTARASLLPRSGKSLVFLPAKTAVAFGSQTGASAAQCRALAKVKLGEAMVSIRGALLPS
jgi:hypothetical protein